MPTLYAGTSGFAYPAWKPAFYPAKMPSNQFLKHYASRLNCVEINYTFRRLPAPGTLQHWVEATPAAFVFAVTADQRNTPLCVAESERLEVPEVITADFVYYRLRKPDYTDADIDAFAARATDLLATGRDLYLMFKHEDTPEGALNAERLLRSR